MSGPYAPLGLLALALASAPAVRAPRVSAPIHEIHSTLTVVRIERGALELRIRTFADDFSASVATFHGRAAPRDSAVSAPDVDRYVRATVRITDDEGRLQPLESCGVERVRDVYLLCYRAMRRGKGVPLRLTNAMLTELHADQVNIVQFVAGASRRSVLLTRESGSVAIPVATFTP